LKMSQRPKRGPVTKIAHPESIWSFIYGAASLTIRSALQYGGLCAEFFYFLLSQFSATPHIFLSPPTSTAQSWFYLLRNQCAAGPVHGLMIFTFAFVVLSLIAFFLSRPLARDSDSVAPSLKQLQFVFG
jgi:hypothetical protein